MEVIAIVAASTITNYAGTIANPPLEDRFQQFAWRGFAEVAPFLNERHRQLTGSSV
jgi:hypothetical protein